MVAPEPEDSAPEAIMTPAEIPQRNSFGHPERLQRKRSSQRTYRPSDSSDRATPATQGKRGAGMGCGKEMGIS
jgi:hypothetical protein